jgi:hypothetical protein
MRTNKMITAHDIIRKIRKEAGFLMDTVFFFEETPRDEFKQSQWMALERYLKELIEEAEKAKELVSARIYRSKEDR